MINPGGNHDRHRGKSQRRLVMFEWPERTMFRDAVAARSASEREIRHHHAHRLAHPDGRNCKIRSSQTKRWQADGYRRDRGHQPGNGDRCEGMDSVVDPHRRNTVIQKAAHLHARSPHAQRCFFAKIPAIPPGSTTRARTRSEKAIAGWYPAGRTRMLNVSTSASTIAPAAAPQKDSSPPNTMITNERSRNPCPKSGLNEYSCASNPPAAPANPMPTPKVSRAIFSTGIPARRPAYRFCINARTPRPYHVLRSTNSSSPSEHTAGMKTVSRTVGIVMGPRCKEDKVRGVRMERSLFPQMR